MLEQNRDILPKFGRAAAVANLKGQKTKKVLLLGSGFVARPCAEYIVRNPLNELTIGKRTTLVCLHHGSLMYFHSLPNSRKRETTGVWLSKHYLDFFGRELDLRT